MAEFPTFKGSWPWPWIAKSYCTPSCMTRRPLPTYRISLKSKKLSVDGRTYGRTFETHFIRSTRKSRPNNNWNPKKLKWVTWPDQALSGLVCYVLTYVPKFGSLYLQRLRWYNRQRNMQNIGWFGVVMGHSRSETAPHSTKHIRVLTSLP